LGTDRGDVHARFVRSILNSPAYHLLLFAITCPFFDANLLPKIDFGLLWSQRLGGNFFFLF